MQLVFAPMWGRLSDRIGRRPIILVSVAVSIVGHLMFALAGALWVLFLARVLSGIGTANFGAAQAVVADTTSGAQRARGMGMLGAAFGLGFILGPALGGAMSQLSAAAPFWLATGLSLVNLMLAWRYLPETHPPERRGASHFAAKRWLAVLDAKEAGRYPNLPRLLLIVAFSITGMGLMEYSLGLLIEDVWVLPAALATASGDLAAIDMRAVHADSGGLTAVVLMAVGITAAVVQGGLLGRLQRRFGERRLVRVGTVVATVGLASIPLCALAGSYALLVIGGGAIVAIGTGLTYPSTNAFISRSVPAVDQGRWLGIAQSLGALGRTLGPAFSGLLFSLHALAPFIAAALLMATAAIVAASLGALREAAP